MHNYALKLRIGIFWYDTHFLDSKLFDYRDGRATPTSSPKSGSALSVESNRENSIRIHVRFLI